MTRSVEAAAREAKIARMKRLIRAGKYETLEKLEDAVDAFLWRSKIDCKPRWKARFTKSLARILR